MLNNTLQLSLKTIRHSVRLASCCVTLLMCVLCAQAFGQVNSQDFPAGTLKRDALPSARTLDYDFESVSVAAIERWLNWVNVTLPVDADGELSGWLWVQRSARGVFDFKHYWLEGEITSPSLKIDQWVIDSARLRFGYRNGTWYVGRLNGDVISPEQKRHAARVELAARLPLDQQALLDLSGTISRVDLASLLRGVAVELPISNSGGELTFNARVPIDQSSDLKYWKGTANLQLSELKLPSVRDPLLVTASAAVQDGQWQLRDSRFVLRPQAGIELPLVIAANGPLESPWPFTVNASSSDLALDELLRQFGLQAWANDVQGRASVTATAVGDAETGIGSAEVRVAADDMLIAKQPLGSISLFGSLIGQTANMQLQSASFLGGSLIGNANWSDLRKVREGKPNRVSLELEGVRLDAVKWPMLSNRIAGVATGRVSLETQANEDGKSAWGSDGELTVAEAAFESTSLGAVAINWSKAIDQLEGNAAVRLAKELGEAVANVTIGFADDEASQFVGDQVGTYRASGSLDNFATSVPAAYLQQASDLNEAAVVNQASVSSAPIPVRATGRFDLEGSTKNWFERGSAQFDSFETRFAGRDLQLTRAIVEATPAELRVRQFTLQENAVTDSGAAASQGSNGRVLGAGILRRDGTGEHLLRLAVSDAGFAPYWNLFAPEAYTGFDGRVSSVVQVTLPANGQRELELSQTTLNALSVKISGSMRGLSFRDEAIGDVDFRGEVEEGALTASAEGDVLQGRAEISVEVGDVLQQLWPREDSSVYERGEGDREEVIPREETTPMPSCVRTADEIRLDARLDAIELARVLSLWNGKTRKVDARGVVSLTLGASIVGGELQAAQGRLDVPRFLHNREVLAQELEIDFDVADSTLSLHQARGRIAGGLVEVAGSIGWPLSQEQATAGDLVYSIQRVDVGQLVTFLYPEIAEQFSGQISYRGRGRLGRTLTFLGAATTANAVVYAFPLQSVRGSLQLDFDRSGTFQNLVASNLVGTALGGQASAEVRVRGGSSYDLQANGRVRRGKMEQLSEALGFTRIVGSENFNAVFEFDSRDAASLAALRGRLQLDFGKGDAQSIPILSDLNRLVPLMQLASTDITSGRLDARIGQGLLIIEDVLLNSEAFWIAGNGTASLSGRNLNLQGVLQTGGGIEAQVSQASVRRLATLLLPEVVFIAELDNLLRNRTLYFRVRGSSNRPVIQPKIAPSIARGLLQEVKRSLLGVPRVIAISDQ